MSEGAFVGSAVAPKTGPTATGPETRGLDLTFAPGWDRQDRWLRFVDPALERAYREAMTAPARRRIRVAGAIACLVIATLPIQIVALFGSVAPISIVASLSSAAVIAAVVVWVSPDFWAGPWDNTYTGFLVG